MKDGPLWSRVSRRMWRSTDFRAMGPMPPCAATLWLYLLTGEHRTKVPGLFVLGAGTMSDDLRWQPAAVRKHLATLVEKGHVKVDADTNLVWIPNSLDHNLPDNPNMVMGWKRDWQTLPSSALKTEARDAIRKGLEALPRPEKSTVTYAEAFAVALGERNPPASGKAAGNGGGNVTPPPPSDVAGTLGGIEDSEREGEKTSSSPTPSQQPAPAGSTDAPKADPTMTKPKPAIVPVAPAIDPESTDPTDILNALAAASDNVFDPFSGAGTDAEVQFQRRLANYGFNVRRIQRLGPILAKHATTMPKRWVKTGHKIRMSIPMGSSGPNGQRGGTWLSVAVGILEAAERVEAQRAARIAAPAVPEAPRRVVADADKAGLIAQSRATSNAKKNAAIVGNGVPL